MLFCENCNKEVVIFGASLGAVSEDAINDIRSSIENEGKLLIINPPPFGPYRCPICFETLTEK